MALIDDLKDDLYAEMEREEFMRAQAQAMLSEAAEAHRRADDLRRAIAALEPAPEAEPAQSLASFYTATPEANEDEEPVEHYSILTGDPAIEPESGLHGEPVPVVQAQAKIDEMETVA